MTASSSAKPRTTLRFILGDQLSRNLSSLADLDKDTDVVLMAEVGDEASYVPHHKKKLVFLFSAMRHFAAELKATGTELRYVSIKDGVSSFTEALEQAIAAYPDIRHVIVTEAAEKRVLDMQLDWAEEFGLDVEIRTDDRFLCDHDRFREWAGNDPKSLRMEYFYRMMRKTTGYLMEGDEPVGGKWNFDKENREALPQAVEAPSRPSYAVDDVTDEVIRAVANRFGNNFGDLQPFDYPVTRRQALHYLNWFIAEALPDFGTYQDAMRQGEPLLFHSHLSALINCGLLDPRECCDRAEAAWRDGQAPLNAVEGFIRQIIGWREFIRGVYWLKMPGYGDENALNATRKLPDFFWTAETDMNCLRQSIAETKANAYAHHIQRLMVIGNFSLIAGLDPREVQEWYLLVYHDAYEWVEMPNVVGMSLFADGGFFASKPYAASGAYIDKMSDYCEHCRYDVKKKNGEKACPFNYLYWDFLMRNRDRLSKNQRMGMILGTLGKMSDEKKDAIRADSARFFKSLA